jgi:hypothetical protein
MKAKLFLCAIAALAPTLGQAADVTISSNNSTLKVTSGTVTGFQLPGVMDWTVDGRKILVYPSGPWTFIDVQHFHPDAHVDATQAHARGPMIGYGGNVTGGAVYTVDGGTASTGVSRIVEKSDIHNKTTGPLVVQLAGMGYKPPNAQLYPPPDYSGLDVSGTTTVFVQGDASNYSIADSAPYPPSKVRPILSFSGLNPLLNENFTIPPGATLTMITELKVKPQFQTLCDVQPAFCNLHVVFPR